MSLIIAFSVFFGAIIIIAFPVMTTMVYADTDRSCSRHDRLSVWRLSTLITTSFLAVYTKVWVESAAGVFIDATTLWVFCALGVTVFFTLSMARRAVVHA